MPGWFVRGQSEQTDAAIREEFVRALKGIPQWAVHQAFDKWVRSEKRRPCPAEIVELSQDAMEPILRNIWDAKSQLAIEAPRRDLPDMAARARLVDELWPGVKRFPSQGSVELPLTTEVSS